MKTFPLGVILTITTGVLLCDIGGVYGILNYMTGDNLFTHQLPRVGREMATEILAQHPQLGEVNADGVDGENWREFLFAQEKRFCPALAIRPCVNLHVRMDPIEELSNMVDADKIIVVQA